jgi:NADPH-dependent 2,4-dienoyl-CoA reductase/sulfur reductase-like enzyme
VIGGGYVGLEAVEAVRANGLPVTLFEADGCFLGRPDETLRSRLLERFSRFGVEFRDGERVTAISADSVNDTPADLVVIATGFRPNAELAEAAGIEIGASGAIRVSEALETNLHGVYAAGDCAEVTHRVTGRPSYIPLGTTANKMGRVAGANAAGRRERFPGVVGTSIVRVCGLGVGVTGLSASQARREGFRAVSAAIEALERPHYFWGTKLTVELVAEEGSGRLLGGTVMGERGVGGRINVLATALSSRMRIDELEFLDLAYAPPYARVWDPLLIAAQQVRKLID